MDTFNFFNSRQELVVNLSKIKVLAFNDSKTMLEQTHITFRNSIIKTITSNTYLGVLFSGPRFSMKAKAPSRVQQGCVTISTLESQCFQFHFHYISSKLQLFQIVFTPATLYGAKVWAPK